MNVLGPHHLHDSAAEGWSDDIIVVSFACGLELIVTEGLALLSWEGTDRALDYPVGEA